MTDGRFGDHRQPRRSPSPPDPAEESDVVVLHRDAGGYRPRDDRPRPRWTPDEPLATRITKRGRFARIDPRKAGRVWSRAEWLGFLAAVLSVGGVLARAWRVAGGLTGAREHTDEPA